MSLSHEEAQEALLALEEGGELDDAVLDDAVLAHLETCEACAGLRDALGAVDLQLAALTPIEPPPALIERTLAAVAEERPAPAPSMGVFGLLAATFAGLFGALWSLLRLLVTPLSNKKVRFGLAVAVPALGVLALFAGSGFLMTAELAAPAPSDSNVQGVAVQVDGTAMPMGGAGQDDFGLIEEPEESEESADGDGWADRGGRVDVPPGNFRFQLEENRRDSLREETTIEGERAQRSVALATPQAVVVETDEEEELLPSADPATGLDRQLAQQLDRLGYAETPRQERTRRPTGRTTAPSSTPSSSTASTSTASTRTVTTRARGYRGEPSYGDDDGYLGGQEIINGFESDARNQDQDQSRFSTVVDGRFARLDDGESSGEQANGVFWNQPVEGLAFHSASGYWANTYLPGDPAMRALGRQLQDQPQAAALAALAQPMDARLDPPRQGALALRVAADRAAVEGRSRVLVSVGLRGAAQRSGRRPTLRAQVVLDLRQPLDAAGQARVRALLTSLSRARDGADRIGVVVAGPGGGELLPLGRLRYGELSVALRRAFAGTGPVTSLPSAMEQAVQSIGQLEDDASPLGTSLVLLVSPGLSDGDAHAVARVAHTGTLAGVTTTTVGLGTPSLPPLERVALAGHGRRRVLADASEARPLVRAELTSVSRVVARAVRVRLRLAEGVQLVDVLGSRRLDEASAQRVREAEQAVDRALAARLGITSDRGDDEDGIQIVVPAFYADDSHTILLDLVVPGPGPVLDAQVRYKDLLRLGNRALTDRVQLARGGGSPGPRERAVMTERLGWEVASALREAAAHLEAGRADLARARLAEGCDRANALRRSVPELGNEPALARDANLCDRYRAALVAGATDGIAGSLRFAAHRRIFGDPLDLGGSD